MENAASLLVSRHGTPALRRHGTQVAILGGPPLPLLSKVPMLPAPPPAPKRLNSIVKTFGKPVFP